MKQITLFLYFTLATVVLAKPGYKYVEPLPGSQAIIRNVRQSAQPSQSGIYSVAQSSPLTSFSLQTQGSASVQQQQQQLQVAQSAPQPQSVAAPQATQEFLGPAPHLIAVPQQTAAVQQVAAAPVAQQPLQQNVAIQPAPLQAQQQRVVYQPQQQNALPLNYQSYQQPNTALVTKDIYVHSSPDDYEEQSASAGYEYNTEPVRRNYRIVFIKAPAPNYKKTAQAFRRAQAATEEKTIIYVLSKKPDINEVQQQLLLAAQTEQKISKPEVYFIKYKTPEEAQRAQQEIQAQYDSLGGSTQVNERGIAPVTHASSIGTLNLSDSVLSGRSASSSTTTTTTQQSGQEQQQTYTQQNQV